MFLVCFVTILILSGWCGSSYFHRVVCEGGCVVTLADITELWALTSIGGREKKRAAVRAQMMRVRTIGTVTE